RGRFGLNLGQGRGCRIGKGKSNEKFGHFHSPPTLSRFSVGLCRFPCLLFVRRPDSYLPMDRNRRLGGLDNSFQIIHRTLRPYLTEHTEGTTVPSVSKHSDFSEALVFRQYLGDKGRMLACYGSVSSFDIPGAIW